MMCRVGEQDPHPTVATEARDQVQFAGVRTRDAQQIISCSIFETLIPLVKNTPRKSDGRMIKLTLLDVKVTVVAQPAVDCGFMWVQICLKCFESFKFLQR